VVVTDGASTYTTTISIATTATTTLVTFVPTFIKQRLYGDDALAADAVSTVEMTATLTHTEYEGVVTQTAGVVSTAVLQPV
jgi:hypothetical protein